MRTMLLFVPAVCAGLVMTSSVWADLTPAQLVALTETSSTSFGVPGDFFRGLGTPTINQQGIVGFTGTTGQINGAQTNNVFLWDGQHGSRIARVGERLADHPTFNYMRLGTPIVSDAGEVAFWADSPAGSAIVAGTPGQLHLLALSGSENPPRGNWLTNVGIIDRPLMSRSGRVGFEAGQQQDRRFYSGTSAGVTLAYQTGVHPPGLAPDVTIGQMGFSRMDDGGNMVSMGTLSGGGLNGLRGMISGGPAGLVTVAAPGLPAPGTGGGVFLGGVSPPNVNGAGIYGLSDGYTLSPPNGPFIPAAWVGPADDRRLLARGGDPVPGVPGAVIGHLDAPVINHSGRALLPITYQTQPNGTFRTGLAIGTPETGLAPLAVFGDPVDNLPAGWQLLNIASSSSATLLFNDRDQAAFIAAIRFNNGQISEALLGATPQGELLAVAVVGQPFQVTAGDSRTVQSISAYNSAIGGPIAGLGGDDGFGTSFNDRGQLAYILSFTDGSRGIFVSVIPSPASVVFLAFGAFSQARRRRR